MCPKPREVMADYRYSMYLCTCHYVFRCSGIALPQLHCSIAARSDEEDADGNGLFGQQGSNAAPDVWNKLREHLIRYVPMPPDNDPPPNVVKY